MAYVRKFEDKYPPCRYTAGVGCNHLGIRCDKCGWNPEVNDARVRAMLTEEQYEIYLNVVRESKRY